MWAIIQFIIWAYRALSGQTTKAPVCADTTQWNREKHIKYIVLDLTGESDNFVLALEDQTWELCRTEHIEETWAYGANDIIDKVVDFGNYRHACTYKKGGYMKVKGEDAFRVMTHFANLRPEHLRESYRMFDEKDIRYAASTRGNLDGYPLGKDVIARFL
nr:hypothetical protein K-LCC10_0354 [Kaumoebavirus]